jgi:ADP-ribosylglycohydrolase
MRLAAVPILFHKHPDLAVIVGRESSLTTHPGSIAADACGFLAFVIARGIARPSDCSVSMASFLDECCDLYLKRPEVQTQATLKRLLLAFEPANSLERCWNWRDPNGPYLIETLEARGQRYNGFPVSAGYFGSYSMDGLAMALHCAYHTRDAHAAITRCVNLLGDADSTGAVCGQIVGSFYGARALDKRLVAAVERWDQGEISLRSALLFALGDDLSDAQALRSAGVAQAEAVQLLSGKAKPPGVQRRPAAHRRPASCTKVRIHKMKVATKRRGKR